MRIAILDPASFALPYVVFLARGLGACGHKVSIFCSRTKYNESLLDELSAESDPARFDIDFYRISRTTAPSRWSGVLAYGALLHSVFSRRKSFDVISLQFGIFLPFDIVFMGLLYGRLQFTIHDDVPHGFNRKWHLPTLIRACCASKLVFTSQAVRDRFLSRYPIGGLRRRVKLLQHGLLAATLQPMPQESEHGRGDPIVTYFSTVKPYKGVEQLVAAKPLLTEGAAVEIHGQWDLSLADLKERALLHGCTVKDEYLSAVALERLLTERRVFVLPYRNASQSGVLYLLLNYAKPFVSTDRGDLGAFLRREGLADLVFPNDDPQALAQALSLAISKYDEISQRLRLVRQRYEWKGILAASDLYRD